MHTNHNVQLLTQVSLLAERIHQTLSLCSPSIKLVSFYKLSSAHLLCILLCSASLLYSLLLAVCRTDATGNICSTHCCHLSNNFLNAFSWSINSVYIHCTTSDVKLNSRSKIFLYECFFKSLFRVQDDS